MGNGICGGGPKSHDELSSNYGDPRNNIRIGCLSGRTPVAEPRLMRSSYKGGSTFHDLTHNLPEIKHIHAYGWLYLLRYSKEVIQQLTELDRITEELELTKRQLWEQLGESELRTEKPDFGTRQQRALLKKVNWHQFRDTLEQVEEVDGEDRTLKADPALFNQRQDIAPVKNGDDSKIEVIEMENNEEGEILTDKLSNTEGSVIEPNDDRQSLALQQLKQTPKELRERITELEKEAADNHVDLRGNRFFAVLYRDTLKMFKNESEAAVHMQDPSNPWENKPVLQLVVFRNSKDGLLSVEQDNYSVRLLFNDD
jgi:hypothetical protein